MTITPGIAKRLRAFIAEAVATEERNMESACDAVEIEGKFLLQKLEPRKAPKKTMTVKPWAKVSQRTARAKRMAAIRAQVIRRSGGQCEAGPCNAPGCIADHWLGGVGRRTQKESVQTVWVLCEACNDDRTANRPSASAWNDRFADHCAEYGYPFQPHIEHQQLRAQHQEKSQP